MQYVREREFNLKVEEAVMFRFRRSQTTDPFTRQIFSTQNLHSKRFVVDLAPPGQYIPGQLKITPLTMQENIPVASECSGVQNDALGRTLGYFAGSYIYPLSIYTSSYLSLLGVDPKSGYSVLRGSAAAVNSPGSDLGESFAETGQTLQMLANPIRGIGHFLKAAMSGRRVKGFSYNDAANKWLEFRYGWDPLVSTLQDLAKDVEIYPYQGIHRARCRTRSTQSTETPLTSGSKTTDWAMKTVRTVVTEETWRAITFYRVMDTSLYAGIRRGSSIFNVPTLAYQLMTLSFALDWWIGIGDWLYANMPNPSVQTLGTTLTYSKKVESFQSMYLTGLESALSGAKPWSPASGTFRMSQRAYKRWVNPEPPPNVPLLDTSFKSVKHALDAVALAYQRGPSKAQIQQLLRSKR